MADVMIPRKRALFHRWYQNNTVFGLDSEIFYFLHERLLIFMVSRRSAIPWIFCDQNQKLFIILSWKAMQQEKFLSVKLNLKTKESNVFGKL